MLCFFIPNYWPRLQMFTVCGVSLLRDSDLLNFYVNKLCVPCLLACRNEFHPVIDFAQFDKIRIDFIWQKWCAMLFHITELLTQITEFSHKTISIWFDSNSIPLQFADVNVCISMTTLLTHTVAHSTKSSFRPKTNNQPLKKVFKSCPQLSKSCQKLDVNLGYKVV